MLRKLLIASASGLAMLVATADSARAEPISASIVWALGFTAGSTAAAIATSAITAAISIGLSFAANALFAPPKPPGGAQLDIQTGGALPRSVTFGKAVSAGALVYWNTYGKKNKFLQLVYRLGDWEFESLDAVWVDGKRKTLTSVSIPGGNNEDARYTVEDFGSDFIIRWFAGTTTQLADTELVSNSNPTGRWTTSHRGRGVCYVSLTLTYNDDKFPGGLPQLLFEYKGAKLYDRRLDTTAGGSGSHRWNDPSTWEWSENPAVCAENFLRGFYRSGERIHGWGLPEAALSITDLVAAMNLCDEGVTDGGASVSRYTCSAITSEGNEQRQGLTAFVEAMGGYYFEAGGVIYVKGGGSETAVATLSEDDLTADGEYEYIEKRGRAELVNRVSGTFTDPENGWQPVDYPEITDSAWVTDDNGEDLGLDYNLPSVTSGYQAERIAKIRANMARLQKRLNIEVLEKHIAISAGDWINYSDSKVGSGIQWLVEGVTEQPDQGTLRLELQEVDADAFAGATLFAPVIVDPPDVDAGQTTVEGFNATGVKIDDGNGEVPAIRLTWTPPADETIIGVKFEYSIVPGGFSWGFDTDADAEDWVAFEATNAVSGGVLEHTAADTDPILISPDSLSLDGSANSIVRMRVRRTAGTGWDGYVFWDTGTGINFSKYVQVSEPAGIDDGFVIVEWDMSDVTGTGDDWVGETIKRFQVHLGNTASDVFEVDWITPAVASPVVVQRAQTANAESGEYYLTDGIAQDTPYQVRATIETDPVRGTTWTDYALAFSPVITALDIQTVRRSTYTTTGVTHTWTKVANPALDATNAVVVIEAWGPGGGGGRGNQSAGGGGGAYIRTEIAYADLPDSLDIDIGEGGAGATSNGANGSPGGTTTVTETGGSAEFARAFGGGGGEGNGSAAATVLGGAGAGLLGAGGGGAAGSAPGELGGGSNPTEGNVSAPTEAGGGAAGNVNDGGDAYYGGAGGGGTTSGTPSSGGSSVYGGDGGGSTAGTGFATGENGQAPGGGGGGGYNANGGTGGRGEVRITVFG